MNKSQIKNILMSMRNKENEEIVNNLLGKIDIMEESQIQKIIEQVGEKEEDIKEFLQKKITKKKNINVDEHKPINNMFSYGVSDNYIHLHLPVDLHQILEENGFSKTMDIVNMYLLDAIEKIRVMKKEGYYRFQGKDTIYMISPILIKRELKFLEGLDFETKRYQKKELNDERFLEENSEAMLAVHIFGKDKNVQTAKIGLEIIQSKEWQEKRKDKIRELANKGIILDDYKDIEKV